MQMMAETDAEACPRPGNVLPVGLVDRDMHSGRPSPGVLAGGPEIQSPCHAWQMDMPPHYPIGFDADFVATYSTTGIVERYTDQTHNVPPMTMLMS